MDRIKSIIGVDHIGYAVKDMKSAREQFSALGYEFGEEKPDEHRKVRLSMGQMGGVKVELLAPLNNEKSPVDGYLSKLGSTPYHICYEVCEIDGAVSELQDKGFTILGVPAYSVPLEGTVCFLYSPEIGLIEIIDYSSK